MGEIIRRPLPPVALPFTGERLTSEYGGQTEIEHLQRYLMARELCRGKDVLDVASGEGYGTALLAQVAQSAVGVEIAAEAVAHAARSYTASNLRFIEGDARKLPIPDAAFDVVVSFETIEHFLEQEQFVREVRRVLRPDGIFVVSTPDRDQYSLAETPPNAFHARELTAAEFAELLNREFAHAQILLQRPVWGSVLLPCPANGATPLCFERRGPEFWEGSAGLARPVYAVAIASAQPLPPAPPSIYIETSRLGLLSPAEVDAHRVRAEQLIEAERARAEAASAGLREQLGQADASLSNLQAELEAERQRARDSEASHQQQAGQAEATLRTELEAERQRARDSEASHRQQAGQAEAALRAELEAERQQRSATEETQQQLLQAERERGRAREAALQAEVAEREQRLEAATAEQRALVYSNEMTERACQVLREQLAEARAGHVREVEEARHRALEAQQRSRALDQHVTELEQHLSEAVGERAYLSSHSANLEEAVRVIRASRSWRITAPIRTLGHMVKRKRANLVGTHKDPSRSEREDRP
jgi:SAM-dependent methyltransferase